MNQKIKIIKVKNADISFISKSGEDYVSLTDIAKYKNSEAPADIIKNWMRNKSTIALLGLWETLHNPDFKLVEFDRFKQNAGYNHFVLSPQKWITETNAIGLHSKSGRYGGTFAHRDIAFEFASWVSVEFKLYLIKEFQRLKEDENNKLKLDWNLQRTLAKINYKIHTDAIKENLIPPKLTKTQMDFIYANEADLLNVALFGKTAKQWRDENTKLKGLPTGKTGNIRDCATLEQLVVLSNLESINSLLIRQDIKQSDRLKQLNRIAIAQIKSLVKNKNLNKLKKL